MDGLGCDVTCYIFKFLDFWSIRNTMICSKQIYYNTKAFPGRNFLLRTLKYCFQNDVIPKSLNALDRIGNSPDWQCIKCGLRFRNSKNMKKHLNNCKGLQKCYKCWTPFYAGQHNIESCYHYHRKKRYGAGRLYGYYTGKIEQKVPDTQTTMQFMVGKVVLVAGKVEWQGVSGRES